ncbi:MAG: type II secretion system GspH family protein [Gemmatimonadota bacterium]|nr:type II secretion system GspH family protein [Gemmatimonadota bacterium]
MRATHPHPQNLTEDAQPHGARPFRHCRVQSRRSGFSIIELIVAMTVISVGLVAASGTMTFVMRQSAVAEFRADRVAVRQYVSERLRGLPYDSVVDGSMSLTGFTADWTVADSVDTKTVTLLTGGPLFTAGIAAWQTDTASFRILKP